jgi:radical SAM protein with 4Fe4S-binding SPASM domain
MSAALRRAHPTLPVFRLAGSPREIFYTPGHIAMAAEPGLLLRAREAAGRARQLRAAPFAPQCLAVALSYRCNLSCGYCYSSDSAGCGWNAEAILAAARLVAENCARAAKPFHLVVQGDGEPSLAWDRLRQLVALTREAASSAGPGWFGYVSTNGVLPEERAAWLARNLSRVNLSCDGPPDIQDAQRPFHDGAASSAAVARTARAILSVCGRLDVRATITPDTVARQVGILEYLRDELGATHVRFEPVYRSSSARCRAFRPDQAELFALHFLEAQQAAQAGGVDLSISGVRLDEIHGPYCDVLRQTLRIDTAGVATACFHHRGEALAIGRWDAGSGRFLLDAERIAALRAAAGRVPEACHECVNLLHCSRGCPDACYASEREPTGSGFRCLLYRQLSSAWLGALLDGRAAPLKT